MRLAVGIPSNGDIKAETVSCVVQALFQTKMSGLGLIFPKGCLIHENRIAIAEEVLEKGFDYLMCIDSDITFKPDSINRLLAQNKKIIGANYHIRGKLPLTNTVLWTGVPPTETFKCEGIAMGFVLIDVGVFKLIDPPWFFFESLGGNAFMGEDYWFCKRAREKGIDVWCDPSIEIGHLGEYKF